jgi:hypothetical protein
MDYKSYDVKKYISDWRISKEDLVDTRIHIRDEFIEKRKRALEKKIMASLGYIEAEDMGKIADELEKIAKGHKISRWKKVFNYLFNTEK